MDAATSTLVHRYLGMIANDGLQACTAWLRSQGFPEHAATEGAEQALRALETVLQSDTGRWILGTINRPTRSSL